MLETELKQYADSLGLTVGVCGARLPDDDVAFLTATEAAQGRPAFVTDPPSLRADASVLLPSARSVVCCLAPYATADAPPGNLSRYARVPDYHTVLRELLQRLADWLVARRPGTAYAIQVDSGPLAERAFAYRAGLGFFGKNRFLIHPVHGSFCFLALLIVSAELTPDAPLARSCADCGRCVALCPGGALGPNGAFRQERCVSLITQLDEATPEQWEILSRQSMVYGCDACQTVCPHNNAVPETRIAPFREPSLRSLDVEAIGAMSGRQFRRVYGRYPFAWRGVRPFRKYASKP